MLTVTLLVSAMMALTSGNDTSINATLPDTNLATGSMTCPNHWIQFNDRCFHFVPRSLSWVKAQQNCQSMDANLASVHSIEEYYAIQNIVKGSSAGETNTWIGGTDCQEENAWFWMDGTPFKFTNWCEGEPNNSQNNQRCLRINYGVDKCWDDFQCYSSHPSVCVKNAEKS
ncbi:type-2 ice-structuring protein-like [Siniperca chuatsi]|uniref:type-2 ice-structuring protein-like n=1 Tax=Siniperca chuatsi TaxID=119488 RepID=UPI001CE028D3|nr:type-2 ice-structuring protein-like [Siniperca chuatsi]